MSDTSAASDPLGVRAATARVMERARDVRVQPDAVRQVAERIAAGAIPEPAWRVFPHWWDDADPNATATYVLLLDALNFSFWGDPKWHVVYQGQTFDGYWALAACLHRALSAGEPILDPAYLLNQVDAATLLRGDDGSVIPLLAERQAALREVGRGIGAVPGGSALSLLEQARGNGLALAREVAERFPSFRDVAAYDGQPVPLYKRAQILVSDLWGAFQGRPPADFTDLAELTMFADYKVPQVLHGLGVLAYSDRVASTLRAREQIPPGDPREVEIRAASVQAVEAIRADLARLDCPLAAFQVDWALWTLGQDHSWPLPYHLTRSVAY